MHVPSLRPEDADQEHLILGTTPLGTAPAARSALGLTYARPPTPQAVAPRALTRVHSILRQAGRRPRAGRPVSVQLSAEAQVRVHPRPPRPRAVALRCGLRRDAR